MPIPTLPIRTLKFLLPAAILLGASGALGQELPNMQIDRQALESAGMKDATIALVLDRYGRLVGVMTEESGQESMKGKAMGKLRAAGQVPEAPKKVRGLTSLSVMAYEGSNCYLIRGSDGTLYVMPRGCQ